MSRRRTYPWTQAQKRAANRAVSNAVRRGALVRPDACEECGWVGRIAGHHDDYDEPLCVRWLCSTCHERAHSDMRNAGLLWPLAKPYRSAIGRRITTFQAARIIGCTSAEVRRLVEAGVLDGRRIGHRIYVAPRCVKRYARATFEEAA